MDPNEIQDREIQVHRHLSQPAGPGSEERIRRVQEEEVGTKTMKPRIVLTLSLALFGISRLTAVDWLSYGHDPQRTGWSSQETDINRENAKSMTLLWKAHLDN